MLRHLHYRCRSCHALNKDTGLSGRGLRHTVVVRRAQQLAIAQYLPGFRPWDRCWSIGRHWDGLPAFSDWHARTMCCRRGAGLLVARRHSMRGWASSPDPASCRCRTLPRRLDRSTYEPSYQYCPVLLFTARDGLCGKVKPPLPTTAANLRLPLRGSPRPCGAPRRRRGRRLAPGPRPAPPRPTTDRPAAPAQAYHRRRSKSDAGCGLLP